MKPFVCYLGLHLWHVFNIHERLCLGCQKTQFRRLSGVKWEDGTFYDYDVRKSQSRKIDFVR